MARTGVIYGESDTRKTTQLGSFARYIYEKTGKETLLASFDGGGYASLTPLISAGIISVFRPGTGLPFPMLRAMSMGMWPVNPEEPSLGALDFRPVDWKRFGAIAIEGLSSISSVGMGHLADKQIKTGEDATNPFTQRLVVNGVVENMTFAGNSRAHFGFVQKQIHGTVISMGALPCEYVMFTALESRTEEDDRTTVYGPQIAGKKATASVPSWVGDCIHAQAYPVKKTVRIKDTTDPKGLREIEQEFWENEVRFHFRSHPDPGTGLRFPAKPRLPKENLPDLMTRWPGAYFTPGLKDDDGQQLKDYLDFSDQLSGGAADEAAEWRDGIDKKFGRGKYAGISGQQK